MAEIALQGFSDNTVYYGNKAVYDIFPQDCVDAVSVSYYEESLQKTAFCLENKSNITLDFCGATLVLHGYIQPFVVRNCKNIAIKNVTVSYSRPIVNEMKVVSRTENAFVCKMGEAFPYRIEDGNFISVGDGWEIDDFYSAPGFMQSFDSDNREGKGIYLAAFGREVKLDESVPWANATYRMKVSERDGLLCFEGHQSEAGPGKVPDYEIGDTVAFSFAKRDLSSIYLERSEDITLENYRILNGAGMGIVPVHCKNIYIDGLKLIHDEKSTGIIANDADCIHAISCSGDFVVRNSVTEGYMDDAVNIHSHFYTYVSGGSHQITALCQGMGTELVCSFDVGDTIRLYRGHSLEAVCDYKILSKKHQDGKQWVFTVDRPVREHEQGDLIENMSTQCNVEISGCSFGKANTHIRMQTRGSVVFRDCKIDLPILFTGDAAYWFESSPCESVTITNCNFGRESAKLCVIPEFTPTEKEPYYHQQITVEHCLFKGATLMEAAHLRKLSLVDNSTGSGKKPVCVMKHCGEVINDGSCTVTEAE